MILKVAVLDYKTIKPYLTLKNLFIVLGVTFFLAFVNKNTLIPLSMVSVFVTIYLSYPFAVGEQNGIDPLYRILGLTRKEVVLGRYLWAFSMNLIGILFGVLLSLLLSVLLSLPFDFKEAGAMLLGLFFIFSLMQAFQFPLFFKLGYMKAKTVSYLPFMLLGGVFVVLSGFLDKIPLSFLMNAETFFRESFGLVLLLAFLVWGVFQSLSVLFSLQGYEKRSF